MGDSSTFRSAFNIISDNTRIAVLEALTERKLENPDHPTLAFAELRRRVGNPDSGNFNYHLNLLRGRFIEKTEEGYQLTTAGGHVVSALVSGVYDDDITIEPTRLGYGCLFCDTELRIRYADGLAIIDCENEEVYLRDTLPPQIVRERSPPELAEVLCLKATLGVIFLTDDVCGACFHPVETTLDLDAADPIGIAFTCICTGCGNRRQYNPLLAAITEPEFLSFFADHGFNMLRDPVWELAVLADVEMIPSTEESATLTIEVTVEDDYLGFILDKTGSVIEIERRFRE